MKVYTGLDEKGRQHIDSRILRYLGSWAEGLSTVRMAAWVDSCTKAGGYRPAEYEEGLKRLRDSGRIAFASGVWYVRKNISNVRPDQSK